MGLFSNILRGAGSLTGVGALNSLGRKAPNPADAARPYLNQIPGIGHENYDPYIKEGREASQMTGEEYQRLLQDPTGFVNQIMGSYKPSEGYNFKKNELSRELSNTAAAGGFAGTQYDESNRGKLIESLLSQDMQQYLRNILGVHGTGLEGKEIQAGRGYDASANLADYLGNNLSQQGGLAYQGRAYQNTARQNRDNAWLKLGAQLAGGFAGRYGGGGREGGQPSTRPGAAWGGY